MQDSRRPAFSVWHIWIFALVVKVILLPFLPITSDEAYYFMWGRHLSFSYLDHPPAISWIMNAAYPLWKTPFGVRLPGVLIAHLAYVPWIFIVKRFNFSSRAQMMWILLLLLNPLAGLGSLIVTPDAPLALFWSCAAWALLWSLDTYSTRRWIALGVLIGLGMLSKYVMVLFFPAVLLWLWWEKKLGFIKRPGPWMAVLVSVVVFAPVLIWNYQNDFASFAFQLNRGLNDSNFNWRGPLQYVTAQIGLLNPILFFILIWYLRTDRRKETRAHNLLSALTVTPFVFFFFTSLRGKVEGNWTICAYPSAMAIIATIVDHPAYFRKAAKWLRAALALNTVLKLIVVSHTINPWLPLPNKYDQTRLTREGVDDVPALEKYRPLFARSYQMAAIYSYYRAENDEVFKLAGMGRLDAYDFLPESTPQTLSYVVLQPHDAQPIAITSNFDLELVETLASQSMVFKLIPKRFDDAK